MVNFSSYNPLLKWLTSGLMLQVNISHRIFDFANRRLVNVYGKGCVKCKHSNTRSVDLMKILEWKKKQPNAAMIGDKSKQAYALITADRRITITKLCEILHMIVPAVSWLFNDLCKMLPELWQAPKRVRG